jgi:hypothetical protein
MRAVFDVTGGVVPSRFAETKARRTSPRPATSSIALSTGWHCTAVEVQFVARDAGAVGITCSGDLADGVVAEAERQKTSAFCWWRSGR